MWNITMMARKLRSDDLLILRKLAPELVNPTCEHAGHMFRSLLPPVSMHVSTSPEDFRERLMKLSDDELTYLIDLIFDGFESLHCVKKEHVAALIDVVESRISRERAHELLELYTFIGD